MISVYTVGSVTVTRGSATVTGIGTAWDSLSGVRYFKLLGTSEPFYHVSSITDDTTLVLTVPYGGVNAARGKYILVDEVTTNCYFPLVTDFYPDPEVFERKAVMMVANEIFRRLS
jgi:hypothetical protein